MDEVLRACVGGPPENESPKEDVEESVPDKRVHAGVEKLDPSCPFSRLPIAIRKPGYELIILKINVGGKGGI